MSGSFGEAECLIKAISNIKRENKNKIKSTIYSGISGKKTSYLQLTVQEFSV